MLKKCQKREKSCMVTFLCIMYRCCEIYPYQSIHFLKICFLPFQMKPIYNTLIYIGTCNFKLIFRPMYMYGLRGSTSFERLYNVMYINQELITLIIYLKFLIFKKDSHTYTEMKKKDPFLKSAISSGYQKKIKLSQNTKKKI